MKGALKTCRNPDDSAQPCPISHSSVCGRGKTGLRQGRGAMHRLRLVVQLSSAIALTVTLLSGAYVVQPGTRLVNLSVIAVDSHGQPVTDLTSDDFQIFDSGREQQIAFFHHTGNAPLPAAPLGHNEFTNRADGEIPRATVILFDLMNESFSSRGMAADQIVHTLQSLENADYLFFYILNVDGRLFMVRGLSGAGSASPPGSDVPWTRHIKPLLDASMRKLMVQRPVDIDVAGRVMLTFQALDTLAVQLSRVPGRKNIVWITDGVPIALGPNRSDTGDFVDFTPQVRQLGEQLDLSNVAIYPVRQVMFGAGDGIGNTSGVGQTGGGDTGIESLQTLNQFAGMTGGRPASEKDIGDAVRQALIDVRTSYQLGYYPRQQKWDNKFHKIRVACRRKGVRIQAETGYFAWAAAPGTRTRQAVGSASATNFDAAEIGLTASITTDPKDGRVAHFDLHINAHDVALAREGNDYLAQLRLTVVHYLTDGRTESEPITPLDFHYSPQQRDDVLHRGIEFAQNVPVGRPGSQLRIIVYDRGSNAVGSLTIPDHEPTH